MPRCKSDPNRYSAFPQEFVINSFQGNSQGSPANPAAAEMQAAPVVRISRWVPESSERRDGVVADRDHERRKWAGQRALPLGALSARSGRRWRRQRNGRLAVLEAQPLNVRSPESTRSICECKGLDGQCRVPVTAALHEPRVGRRPDMLEGPRLYRVLTAATAPLQGTFRRGLERRLAAAPGERRRGRVPWPRTYTK